MRVAVIFFAESRNSKLKTLSVALSSGMESLGYQVEIIDGFREKNITLTGFSYIAVGTESVSLFGGRISPTSSSILSTSGSILGKRSFAFTSKKGLRNSKTLLALMRVMETEGMLIKNSAVLSTKDDAFSTGSKLHIE